jgi:hypothetical protein
MRPLDVSELEPPVTKRISRSHQTQWAAQFAVASELCKRGYEVLVHHGQQHWRSSPLMRRMSFSS